jgi:hypothetical protein
MRLAHLAAVLVVAIAASSTLACVDVPANIQSAFAAPGPTDRSNYRPGNHGTAPPAETPEPAVASPTAKDALDGAAPTQANPASPAGDGGVS